MKTCVIIPIKASELCKTRLRPALSDEQRRALVDAMLLHVIETAWSAPRIDETFLLAPPSRAQKIAIPVIADPGGGLNAALTHALSLAQPDVTRLIVIAADLPHLTEDDIAALADHDENTIAIAPDHLGHGTNALSLPLPKARGFRFRFGQDSFALHAEEIARLDLDTRIVRSASLALDIDVPEDLVASALLDAQTNKPQKTKLKANSR